MSSNDICAHFLRGECKYGDHCKYSHQQQQQQHSRRNNNNDNDDHHHQQDKQRQQPHDYQSAQTQMEIISHGLNAIIDIQQLLTANEPLAALLFKLPSNHPNPNDKADLILALDFHGVTDLVADVSEEISPQHKYPICVVSYVGPFGEIRDKTRENLKQRVASGQIKMGIMVFKKLRDPNERDIPPIEFVASKRHAVELLLKYNAGLTTSGRILFVDDSKDNVATVDSLKDNRVKCAFLAKGTTGAQMKAFLREQVQ
jgi:hypothetical protein